MLRIKQIGTICFAISIFISAPSFATGISSGASSAGCDNSTLNTYSGTSNLQAGWQANTIQLHWYSEDNEIQNVPSTSQSCTYDGSLTPPPVSYVPTRTGYTFKGWRVRPPVCSLSSLKPGIQGTAMSSVSENGQVNNYNGSNAATLGLVNNEWAVTFSYGVLLGKVKCSAKVGDNGGYMWSNASSNWKATESELDSAGPGNYCWCKPTKFIPDGGSMCYVSSTNWLFFEEEVDTCSSGCAYWCATQVFQTVSFRQRMYKNL